jgi:hypothetical protein
MSTGLVAAAWLVACILLAAALTAFGFTSRWVLYSTCASWASLLLCTFAAASFAVWAWYFSLTFTRAGLDFWVPVYAEQTGGETWESPCCTDGNCTHMEMCERSITYLQFALGGLVPKYANFSAWCEAASAPSCLDRLQQQWPSGMYWNIYGTTTLVATASLSSTDWTIIVFSGLLAGSTALVCLVCAVAFCRQRAKGAEASNGAGAHDTAARTSSAVGTPYPRASNSTPCASNSTALDRAPHAVELAVLPPEIEPPPAPGEGPGEQAGPGERAGEGTG